MHLIHSIFVFIAIGLPIVCPSATLNNTIATIHHSHDNENTTHGQLSQSRSTIAACVLPHCYDIINGTGDAKSRMPNDQIARNSANTNTKAHYETASHWMADGNVAATAAASAASPSINIDDQHWASSSVMYGLLTHNTKDYVNEQCYGELRQIYNGIRRKETWAIKGQWNGKFAYHYYYYYIIMYHEVCVRVFFFISQAKFSISDFFSLIFQSSIRLVHRSPALCWAIISGWVRFVAVKPSGNRIPSPYRAASNATCTMTCCGPKHRSTSIIAWCMHRTNRHGKFKWNSCCRRR